MGGVMKQARWVISESGLLHLTAAGMTIGWLRAWLCSAGADVVKVSLLESTEWLDEQDDWRIFFASELELESIASCFGEAAVYNRIALDNPPRSGCSIVEAGITNILLPLGDITYQRLHYLNIFCADALLKPLYIYADQVHPIKLEVGLSASFEATFPFLNAAGALIEEQVISSLRCHGLVLRTVESCTAGMIAARLCRVPGASDVIDRAWVTYTNRAKHEMVGVSLSELEQHGAVSEAVVRAMAKGALTAGVASIAVSGIAGPGGGSVDKPVGTVWIALALPDKAITCRALCLSGARHEIQAKSVVAALQLLLDELSEEKMFNEK
ncbi:MAG: CinA family protein [Mariprofundus sp.]|nr:CinA family protein [Mariprofundus sp.]